MVWFHAGKEKKNWSGSKQMKDSSGTGTKNRNTYTTAVRVQQQLPPPLVQLLSRPRRDLMLNMYNIQTLTTRSPTLRPMRT